MRCYVLITSARMFFEETPNRMIENAPYSVVAELLDRIEGHILKGQVLPYQERLRNAGVSYPRTAASMVQHSFYVNEDADDATGFLATDREISDCLKTADLDKHTINTILKAFSVARTQASASTQFDGRLIHYNRPAARSQAQASPTFNGPPVAALNRAGFAGGSNS